MRVFLSPTFIDRVIEYKFGNDKIQATEGGVNYLYDFTNLVEGFLTEPTQHIVNAKRVDGELSVELVNPINENSTEEERFPSWVDITNPTTVTGTNVNLSWLKKSDMTQPTLSPSDTERITALEEAILLLMMEG